MGGERIEYVVASNGCGWTITAMNRVLGTHARQLDAIQSAIEAARDAGIKGHQAEVLVRDHVTLRSAWTFGIDPFPPPRSKD